jgi:two-component system chemotaxis response regulator CheB
MAERQNVVVIGSSTGGPRVLERVFSGMPRLACSIVIVNQMVKAMNPIIRDRLARVTNMEVIIAKDSSFLTSGKLYIAPSEIHLKLVGNSTIALAQGERVNNVRPSIDVAMRSLEARDGDRIVGVILTGAGRDGADGIKYIKEIGGLTIAQDEKSSPLPTMPKAAIATGKIDLVLTPEDITGKLVKLFGEYRGSDS